MNKIFYVLPFLFATSLHAKALTLTAESDIKRAQEMSQAIDAVSQRVMACPESSGGSREVCVCASLESCKFKKEYEKAISLYCEIKTDYPEWANKPVNYFTSDNKISNALGMEALEIQFGKYCK